MKFSKSLLCLLLALSLFAGCAGAFAEESGFPLVNEPHYLHGLHALGGAHERPSHQHHECDL